MGFGGWDFRQPPPQSNDPAPEPEPEVDLDPDGVGAWRLGRLIDAGWPFPYADLLAADHTVDLHRACELLERGCDLERRGRF